MRKLLFVLLFGSTLSALAATPQEIVQSYGKDFSAARGEQLFRGKHNHSSGKTISCATCHTDNPKAQGRNEKTGKDIAALAPAANRERITDPANVEKWFKRNCQDVLERACTPQEKGDFLTWLISVK